MTRCRALAKGKTWHVQPCHFAGTLLPGHQTTSWKHSHAMSRYIMCIFQSNALRCHAMHRHAKHSRLTKYMRNDAKCHRYVFKSSRIHCIHSMWWKSEMLMAPCNSKGIDSLACCIEFAGSKWLKAPYPRAGKRGVPYGQTRIQYQRNYLARKTDVHYVHHEYSWIPQLS